MASQILTPFRTMHLWRRSYEGRENYNVCATIADEPVTCPAMEKRTLHPGISATKLITLRWVQGV
jgi:hypothetical protein